MINVSLVETTQAPVSPTPEWIRTIYSIYLIFILVVGLPGNIIIAIIYGRQLPKTACDWLILTMGVTDAVVCLFSPILSLRSEFETEIPGMNGVWCGLEHWLQTTAMIASLIILVIIAMDRYVKICKPTFQSLTPLMARHVCGWSVLVSGALCVYPTIGSFKDDICLNKSVTLTRAMRIYYTCVFCCFVFSFFLVTFAYFNVCRQIGEKIKIKQRLMDNDGVTFNASFQSTYGSDRTWSPLMAGCFRCMRTYHVTSKPCKISAADDEHAAFLGSATSPKINVHQAEQDSAEITLSNGECLPPNEPHKPLLTGFHPRLEKMDAIDLDLCFEANHTKEGSLSGAHSVVKTISHSRDGDSSMLLDNGEAIITKPVHTIKETFLESTENRFLTTHLDSARSASQGIWFNRRNFILNLTQDGREQLIYYTRLSEPSLTRNFTLKSHGDSADRSAVCESQFGHFPAIGKTCCETDTNGICFFALDKMANHTASHNKEMGGTGSQKGPCDTQHPTPWLQRSHFPNKCIIKSSARTVGRSTSHEGDDVVGMGHSYLDNWDRWNTSVYKMGVSALLSDAQPGDVCTQLLLSSLASARLKASRYVNACNSEYGILKRPHSLSCLEKIHSLTRSLEMDKTPNTLLNITDDDKRATGTDTIPHINQAYNPDTAERSPHANVKQDYTKNENCERVETLNSVQTESLTARHCETNGRCDSAKEERTCADVCTATPSNQLNPIMKHTHSITSRCSRDSSRRTKHSSFEEESVVEEDRDAYGDLATAIFLSKLRRGRDQGSKTSKSSVKSSGSRRRFAKERQMTYMLLCVTIAFLLSWIPPWIIYMTNFYASLEDLDPVLDRIIFKHLVTIQLVNFVVNPIIYYVFNPTFRSKVKDLIPFMAKSAETAHKC
ncbi:hypothetical protein Btru_068183 [Bulinus truncatus]|nr:hypothetical protein Btru_068183 [Bulinus truncatus]